MSHYKYEYRIIKKGSDLYTIQYKVTNEKIFDCYINLMPYRIIPSLEEAKKILKEEMERRKESDIRSSRMEGYVEIIIDDITENNYSDKLGSEDEKKEI